MRSQRGIALLEIIVVGFAVVLMVLPVMSTVVRLTEASAAVHAAARDNASWIARHGGGPQAIEEIELTVVDRGSSVEVAATMEVTLVAVGGATVTRTVRSTVEVPVSRYRSEP